MHPIPKNSESLKGHPNNPNLESQKPLKGSCIRRRRLYSSSGLHHNGPTHALKISTLELIYTLRKTHLSHGGQISFPGGHLNPEEKSEQAVAREIEEELSIKAETVELIGELPPFIYIIENTKLLPLLPGCDTESMTACPNEVEEIIRVSHEQLLDSNRKKPKNGRYVIKFIRCPIIKYRVPLWGATAMITAEWLRFYQSLTPEIS